MKCKLIYKNLIVAIMVLVIAMFSVFTVVAAPEDEVTDNTEQTVTQEPTEPQTTSQEEDTSEVPEETEETSEITTTQEQPETQEITTQKATQQNTQKPTEDKYPLPTVNSDEVTIPTAIGSGIKNTDTNILGGIISWVCVGIGVAVVIGVILSTKNNERKNIGKNRYGGGDKITGKKRMLSDEYYQRGKNK